MLPLLFLNFPPLLFDFWLALLGDEFLWLLLFPLFCGCWGWPGIMGANCGCGCCGCGCCCCHPAAATAARCRSCMLRLSMGIWFGCWCGGQLGGMAPMGPSMGLKADHIGWPLGDQKSWPGGWKSRQMFALFRKSEDEKILSQSFFSQKIDKKVRWFYNKFMSFPDKFCKKTPLKLFQNWC